ncbi:MAG TPA: alpha-glucosidase [Acidimicrobiia bacterium]|nr:alpha-glucosidase [Acidimicrobiia bacterium]
MAQPPTPPPIPEPWWKSAVVYQVYLRSFRDSNGDGLGDLAGLVSKIDYLSTLGVDVVWVTPFYDSPQHDNGYDISDYQSVHPAFGTLEDVDRLIDELHRRDMRLVLDVVINHTSDEHPWFLESRAGPESGKRDWYWWRPPREGSTPGAPGAEPTNWISFFSGPAWTFDEDSGEYYLHLFSRHQPDLNWENDDVREALYSMLRWWLDRGVDGFRLDVINMVSKRLPLEDGPPLGVGHLGDGSDSFLSGPRIHQFMQEFNDRVIAPSGRTLLTVGEMPGVTTHEALLFTDPARGELTMVFQFEHMGVDHGPGGRFDVRPARVIDLKTSLARWQTALAETGWNSLYWNNHDQPRVVSRFGSDTEEHRRRSAKALGTVLHMHRGTPFIYQGEEIGMTNYPFESIDAIRDIESLNYHRLAVERGHEPASLLAALQYTSRDNARTPMQWDGGEKAGFTNGEPWLAVNPNHVEINVAAELEDPGSVLHHYRRLIELRHQLEVVRLGEFTLLLPEHEQVYAFTRSLDREALLIVANLTSAEAHVELPEVGDWEGAEVLISTYHDPPAVADLEALRPWETTVFRR